MAGAWIKVEGATADKPEVLKVARILGVNRDEVLGKLVRLWFWFDNNSVDGRVDGVVDADVDALVATPGFSSAMQAVNWLVVDNERAFVSMPRFDRHNGESSKKRALKSERQARWRSTQASTEESTGASTRVEKRREEKKDLTHPPSSDASPVPLHPLVPVLEERPSLETVVTPPGTAVTSALPVDKSVPRETSKSAARGTRFDPKGGLPAEWRAWCVENRPDLKPEATFDAFSDFWVARAGAIGVKLDWFATWRNWCRREKPGGNGVGAAGVSRQAQLEARNAAALRDFVGGAK